MNGTGTVTSKDVSAGSQSVTPVNLVIADGTGGTAGLASNYSLSSSNLIINKKPINTIYLSRQYNASNSVAGSDLSSMTGLIGSETLTLSGSTTMSSANVGTNSVNAALFTLGNGSNGGLANNYTVSGGSHTMVITQRPLNATLARQYDATTTSAGSTLSSFDALQGGETLTMTGSGTAASKNVANGIAMSSNGTLALVDGTGLASNYSLNSTVINISKRVLNSSGSKTYDANTDALASAITLSNLASTETLVDSGTASTSSANAGSYTISNLTGISIADGTNGGLASNYTLTGGTHNFTINRRVVGVSGTRLYDATTNAAASDLATHANLVGSQTLSLSGTGTIASKNVGSNKTVSIGTLALADGSNGGLAANYTLTGGTHQLTVNQRPLNATLARQYDATTTSAGSTLSSFDALQGGENLTMTGSGTAASKNVANGITMSSNGNLALADGTGLASNYSLNSTVINISKRVLNSSGSKTYDANTDALAGAITLSNFASTETLNHSGTASTSSANAASYTISNLTGVSIADGTNGGLASNYTLTGGTHNFTVNRRVVGVSGTRLYDATTNAVASDLSTHANLVGSETLTLSGTGTIASKNVGSNKTVSIGTLALADGSNGGLAANYTLSGGTHQLTVNQRPLNATLARQYDATTTAAGSTLSSFDALQGGETLTMSGSGTAASKDVANGIAMSSNGTLALVDGTGLASNYSLNSTVINISKRVLNSSGSKTYDANTDALASAITLSNLASTETLVDSGTATISSANVGSYTISNLTGISIADGTNGGLASNYTLTGGTHNFTVNRRVVGVSGTRLYDATTNAVASDLSTHANLVGSETLTLSGTGTIASKNVGSNKTVSIGTLALGDGTNGGLAANYTLTGGTHQLTVNQRPLNAPV